MHLAPVRGLRLTIDFALVAAVGGLAVVGLGIGVSHPNQWAILPGSRPVTVTQAVQCLSGKASVVRVARIGSAELSTTFPNGAGGPAALLSTGGDRVAIGAGQLRAVPNAQLAEQRGDHASAQVAATAARLAVRAGALPCGVCVALVLKGKGPTRGGSTPQMLDNLAYVTQARKQRSTLGARQPLNATGPSVAGPQDLSSRVPIRTAVVRSTTRSAAKDHLTTRAAAV